MTTTQTFPPPPRLLDDVDRHYAMTLGRDVEERSAWYLFLSAALATRDRLAALWRDTNRRRTEEPGKRVFYLSLEFLLGRALTNTVMNLDLEKDTRDALSAHGTSLEELAEQEPDAGLGNGGLGRLAACFLDSCASLDLPVTGYGLRYEYGMFLQSLEDGYQVESPDHWLLKGYPWEFERYEHCKRVKFYGRSEEYHDATGHIRHRWVDTHDVVALPYDLPVPGYRNGTVNTLRLWTSEATDRFDLGEFNAGSYAESVAAKNEAENITMVLYPNDASENGKALRLQQQYFLASASLQDVLDAWIRTEGPSFGHFAERHCFQLNDTHPAIAVAELMRLLLDEHHQHWDEAWQITRGTMAYTNHTLLPEALESWPVSLFQDMLPRLLEIIYEINARFLAEVAHRWPGDLDRQRHLSLIDDSGERRVRMAHLAIVGSFSVNGVAALHTELLREGLFHDFAEMWPGKFNNKTNGVTPRRWVAHCNPALAELITMTIGDAWVREFENIERLIPYADDLEFQRAWLAVRHANKERLSQFVAGETGVTFLPSAMIDVQVKRIHEYKRQLLNVMHVIWLYDRIHSGEIADDTPNRCVLIGGKAAPGYAMAKLIIKLITNVAQCVNTDPAIHGRLKVAFLPNYRVTAMEHICPATDLSEQISTAGKEASGTGNMKLMMNGAVTIGTADGANIEIHERVGPDNFFLFGMTADEVQQAASNYDPNSIIANDDGLSRVMQLLEGGHFNLFEPGIFDPIVSLIRNPADPWMLAADFREYVDAQCCANEAYVDQRRWARMSILNTAHSGFFSSDRTIMEYERDIWHTKE